MPPKQPPAYVNAGSTAAPSQASDTARSFDRLPSLTGLRFVAAFFVFGFHVTNSPLFADHERLAYIFRQGATGVSFFFILSGFVLTWSSRSSDRPHLFWRRRAAKVYPNHLATAMAMLLALVAIGEVPSAAAIVSNVLLVQAWVPRESVFFGLNTPSWSLSCEVLFYLCFPLLLLAIGRLRERWLWPATAIAVAGVWAVPAVASALPHDLRYWFVYVFPPARMLEFVIGILLARIVRSGRWMGLGVLPAAALALAGYFASGYLPGGFSYVAGTVVSLALLVAAVASADLRGSASPLRTRAMIWFGEISFAFYLVHQLIIRAAEKLFTSKEFPQAVEIGLMVTLLAVSVVISWALYQIVEKPMMRRLTTRRAEHPSTVPRSVALDKRTGPA